MDESATRNWNEQQAAGVHYQFLDDDDEPAPLAAIVNQAPQQERRSQRQRFPSSRLADYEVIPNEVISSDGDLVHMALLAYVEPVKWKQAIQEPEWNTAMKEEISAIERNHTWELVNLPPDKKPIVVKWVFKVKRRPDGSVSKHKPRLVAKGFFAKGRDRLL